MRTYDITFIDKNTKENISTIRENANGKDKAKSIAIKHFKYTHKNMDMNNIDIKIKQIDTNNENWL